jgi:hypothetical protein
MPVIPAASSIFEGAIKPRHLINGSQKLGSGTSICSLNILKKLAWKNMCIVIDVNLGKRRQVFLSPRDESI